MFSKAAYCTQVINLGVHMLDPTFPHAVLLMEVMPTLLARREFPPPDTMQTLEPGFRDSPDPGHDLAIVFLRVRTAPAVCECNNCRMVLQHTSTGAQAWQDILVMSTYGHHLLAFHHVAGCEIACSEVEHGSSTLLDCASSLSAGLYVQS